MSKKSSSLSGYLFIAIAMVCLFPWFAVQIQLSINGDAAWLMTAAERMLNSESMAVSFYEVNPPLSILYHIPPVILSKILLMPAHIVLFLYFTALIALSTWAMNILLREFDFLENDQRFVILAAYLAANTIFTTIALGERDHIVLLGLAPFLLAQLAITWGFIPKSRDFFWVVMGIGTLVVLIKPHYGLLPVCLLLHRLITQKSLLSIFRSPDFRALAIGTLTYIAVVILFFRDFIHIILPDVLELYITNKDYASALPELFMHTYLFLVFLGIEAFFSPLTGERRRFLIMLYAAALLCLVPYAVQMKGFYYQLIPAMGFFFCAFALSLHSYAANYLKDKKNMGVAIIVAIFLLAYLNRPLLLSYPTHSDYERLPLTKIVNQCPEPCSYFIFHDNIEIMHTTAFYQGKQLATRFPTYWFLPKLAQEQYKLDSKLPAELTAGEILSYREKYGDMTAVDLAIYRPKMLLIGQYRLTPDDESFDFSGFFSASEAFQDEWAHYRKENTITINQKPYFAGTALAKDYPLTYDIYVRNEP